jgi:transcription termination factor Rho
MSANPRVPVSAPIQDEIPTAYSTDDDGADATSPEPAERARPEPAERARPEPVEGARPEPVEGARLPSPSSSDESRQPDGDDAQRPERPPPHGERRDNGHGGNHPGQRPPFRQKQFMSFKERRALERQERAERGDRAPNEPRQDRGPNEPRQDRPDRGNFERGERPDRGPNEPRQDRPDRGNFERGERPDRGQNDRFKKRDFKKARKPKRERVDGQDNPCETGDLPQLPLLRDPDALAALAAANTRPDAEPLEFNRLLTMPLPELAALARDTFQLTLNQGLVRDALLDAIVAAAWQLHVPVMVEGAVDLLEDGDGLIVYEALHYRVRAHAAFLSRSFMKRYAIKRGTVVRARIHPRRKPLPDDALEQLRALVADQEAAGGAAADNADLFSGKAMEQRFPAADFVQDAEAAEENCPYVIAIESLMGKEPQANLQVTPFEDLVPYYPTERILLETEPKVKWDNLAMRAVDLLTPVGLGQRGLIVAPPRTGKTIIQQSIANAIAINKPNAHLIVLLIDERPEEVTDFRRQVKNGEVIASTFDESPENHVHCAEMVIEKARRMVEAGRHVIILLDSITRLARAYNALAANSGKILSGGVEATALQKPKRFFGSARNIEGGGSLTVIGTALVETGSRMDEVIFEEFKGTGNMELHLDRALSDKRIFPAIEMNKSGTRKEELLYHPDEMQKVYSLRRAMKGVPPTDAMEMLISRLRKTTTNIQFLVGLNS